MRPAKRQQGEPSDFGLKRRAFRPGRQWAVDNVGSGGYAHTLGPAERAWLERFNREYYDADNKALRSGQALHATDALRRDCYARQNCSHRDVYARGMVTLAGDGEQAHGYASRDERRGFSLPYPIKQRD